PQGGAKLGVAVADLLPRVRGQFRIPDDVEGVVVVQIEPNGPAAEGALEEGDVRLEVQRKRVTSVSDLRRVLDGVESGTDVLLYVSRNGRKFWQTVTAGGRT